MKTRNLATIYFDFTSGLIKYVQYGPITVLHVRLKCLVMKEVCRLMTIIVKTILSILIAPGVHRLVPLISIAAV